MTKSDVGQLRDGGGSIPMPRRPPVRCSPTGSCCQLLGRNAGALVALDPADRQGDLGARRSERHHQQGHQLSGERQRQGSPADLRGLDSFLQEIDATTGKSITSFGDNGISDMRVGLPRAEGNERTGDAGESGADLAQHHDLRRPVGRSHHDAALRHSRLRCAHRPAALAVPHHAASRRVRLRDRTRPDGYSLGGANNWGEMSIDEARGIVYIPTGSVTATSTAAIAPAEPVRQLPARAGRQDRQASVAFSDGAPRPLGSRQRLGTATGDRDPQRQEGGRRGARRQDRLSLRVQPRHRPAALANRGASGPQSDVPFEKTWPTQPFPTKPAPFVRQSFTEEDVNPWLLTPESTKRSRSGSARRRTGRGHTAGCSIPRW